MRTLSCSWSCHIMEIVSYCRFCICLTCKTIPFPSDKGSSHSKVGIMDSKILHLYMWKWASLLAQMVKNPPAVQEPRFDPWVGKIPWRREWQPTPVFLPGEVHGQRSLVGFSPWGRKELDTAERLTLSYMKMVSNWWENIKDSRDFRKLLKGDFGLMRLFLVLLYTN